MFGRDGRFVGHVGGDDFFVAFRGVDGEAALAEVHQAVAKFKSDVESLYPAEDRSNGYITAPARTGEIQRFPLLAISGAIVHKPQDRPLPSMDNLSALIAEAKKAAKKSDDRIVRVCI